MAGTKIKETVTKILGKLRDEVRANFLRTGAKSRASYSQAKGNRGSGQTQEGLGRSGKGLIPAKGIRFML